MNKQANEVQGRENRRHERLYLSPKDGIKGVFTHTGHRQDLEASIMDISLGGVGLALRRVDKKGVSKGDLLVLKKVEGTPYLRSMANIVMRIRWVLYHDTLEHIGCGCEFINIPQVYGLLIQQFMNAQGLRFRKVPDPATGALPAAG